MLLCRVKSAHSRTLLPRPGRGCVLAMSADTPQPSLPWPGYPWPDCQWVWDEWSRSSRMASNNSSHSRSGNRLRLCHRPRPAERCGRQTYLRRCPAAALWGTPEIRHVAPHPARFSRPPGKDMVEYAAGPGAMCAAPSTSAASSWPAGARTDRNARSATGLTHFESRHAYRPVELLGGGSLRTGEGGFDPPDGEGAVPVPAAGISTWGYHGVAGCGARVCERRLENVSRRRLDVSQLCLGIVRNHLLR